MTLSHSTKASFIAETTTSEDILTFSSHLNDVSFDIIRSGSSSIVISHAVTPPCPSTTKYTEVVPDVLTPYLSSQGELDSICQAVCMTDILMFIVKGTKGIC